MLLTGNYCGQPYKNAHHKKCLRSKREETKLHSDVHSDLHVLHSECKTVIFSTIMFAKLIFLTVMFAPCIHRPKQNHLYCGDVQIKWQPCFTRDLQTFWQSCGARIVGLRNRSPSFKYWRVWAANSSSLADWHFLLLPNCGHAFESSSLSGRTQLHPLSQHCFPEPNQFIFKSQPQLRDPAVSGCKEQGPGSTTSLTSRSNHEQTSLKKNQDKKGLQTALTKKP